MNWDESVAAVFDEVLRRRDIDTAEQFFAAGGDPLAAARIVARVRQECGVHIQVADFLEVPTVAALTALARDALARATTVRSPLLPAEESALLPGATTERSTVSPAVRSTVVTRRAPDAAPVLSFGQQRIWLENQLLPGEAYNVHGRRRLIGDLDIGVLRDSVRAVVARHEALRTRFPLVDGQPVQVVDDPDPFWTPAVVDAGADAGPAEDPDEAARRLADAEAAEVFDLAAGPLFRCSVIKVRDGEHLLALTVHHIVSDAWSIRLFVQELAALYSAGGDVRKAELPALPMTYRDFASWQRERLAGRALRDSVEFWRRHLDGAPPALLLPPARRRTVTQGGDGRRWQEALSPRETAGLRETCRKHGVTTFMALLAGLTEVLGRWSGQDDVVIGVPVAGRNAAGTDGLIGFFVNTLPIRMRVCPDGTELEGRLVRARRAALDAFAHAETPLDVLVRELQPARDPRRTPLFQVILNVIGSPVEERISGLRVEAMASPVLPPIVDLVVTAQEVDGSLTLTMDFDADRLADDLVRELAGRLCGRLAGDQDPPAAELAERAAVPASIEVPELSTSGDIESCIDRLRSSEAAEVYLTAPMLRAAAGRQLLPLPTLRRLFIDNRGDLLAQDVDAARRLAPAAQVIGVYGTIPFVVPEDWRVDTAPLRVPLATGAGLSVSVRRYSGEPARPGELGEIWCGSEPTGDLGRLRPDGTVDFVARAGDSLLLDLAEPVAALRDLPAIVDAVVRRHEFADGTAVLAGYVVGASSVDEGEAASAPARLRRYLALRLPEYLIPDRIFVLDALPLTADGRYDLDALPVPDPTTDEDRYVAPRTPMEAQLAELLRDLLDVERVGVTDSFFDLGGFSLLATQLAAGIQTAFGVELRLRDLFAAPTVDELAQLVLRVQGELAGGDDLEALLAEIEAAP